MGSIGEDLTMDFVIHFETNGTALRVGEKRCIGSTGSTQDGGMAIQYFECPVFCDRNTLVGKVLQTAIVRDMRNADAPAVFRMGGLCSILTMSIHPGLVLEYRGHSISIQTAQNMRMGELVNHSPCNRMRLIGKMDVFACLPCLCFFPKLLSPTMIPWNQYDVFNPSYDFLASNVSELMDRGFSPSAPVEEIIKQKSTASSSKDEFSSSTYSTCSESSSRDNDIEALKQLKNSRVLSHAEYIAKVNQVNAKYNNAGSNDRVQSEIDAITKLYQDGILTEQEYETKREIIMNLRR